MNIELFALCDAATDQQGKLNILGMFDRIFTRQIPAIHPQCSIALRVRFSRIESGAHKVKINFVDEDGKSIMQPLDATLNIQINEPEQSIAANLVLNVQQLKLEKFGHYSIDVAIDGRQEASIPLYVVQIPPQN